MAIQQTKTYLLIFFSFIYSITSLYADYIDRADYARDTLMLIPKPQSIKIQNATHLFEDTINNNKITIQYVSSIPQALVNQKEAYHLTITPDSIFIKATADQGVYWAKQTLNQLITQYRSKHYLPCCDIVDWPAFHIRGFMHDVGRSYISPDELKKEIAILSTYKINTFHWHLTEDLGWRLESKIYPQLNDSANFGRLPGKYYTIDEAKDIAAFCKAHQVLLIPEIDMPGHSAAFRKTFGCDMQSPEGMSILKQLLKEICIEIFPDLPYLHIGTDEVEITNPKFVPEMVQHIRSMGKKVISWNPGYAYHPGEIDMIHMWSSRGKPLVNTPTIDSRYHYINHFDNFADLIALYNSNIGNREYEKDNIIGAIMAVWNDRFVYPEKNILIENAFYPLMLTFAESSWQGGRKKYFDQQGTLLKEDSPEYRLFIDFENRMLWHKQNMLNNLPFPYVRQTNVKWRITDAFPNYGNLQQSFPPEKKLKTHYTFQGKTYHTREAIGAAIYLRHVWGEMIPSFYTNPKPNHTAYAYTWVRSPKTQTVGAWISTQNYSRSEKDLPPPQGEWDYRKSKIMINDKEIQPPVWSNNHTILSSEIPLGNENFAMRPPIPVTLKKGWNKILLKLPIGEFSTKEVRLQKWMFTFVFVTLDGKQEVEGLIYNPDKKIDKENEKQ